jgi:hypothetical protein
VARQPAGCIGLTLFRGTGAGDAAANVDDDDDAAGDVDDDDAAAGGDDDGGSEWMRVPLQRRSP